MADYIILHCVDFMDDGHQELLEELKSQLEEKKKTVELYNLPKSNRKNYWEAVSLYDYSRYCECLICIDYPAGFVEHKRKKVIVEFEKYDINHDFKEAIGIARNEAYRVISLEEENDTDAFDAIMEAIL